MAAEIWHNPETTKPETYQEYCVILNDLTFTTGMYMGDGDWFFYFSPFEGHDSIVMFYTILPDFPG